MEAFGNRLKKNDRHLSKWARRQGITCYRVYDHDIPEYPFAVEKLEEYVHVSEYAHKHEMDEEAYSNWLHECISVISTTLNVPLEHLFIKERRVLSRRTEQYEKVAVESKRIVANEHGLKYWINLTDYLDTGLFLDHRPLRKTFIEERKGKKVLNLFAYTGSFSVCAVAGGASHVTTVDLSNNYLNWAKDNFELNGFSVDEHAFIQADTMTFLRDLPREQYDLVFVDPPTFSNSKRMKGTWDTQRDHPEMLHLLLKHVKKGGVVYFSNNLRNFKPDFSALEVASITDISQKTIPEDFRNKKIHHCFRIVK